MAKYRIIVEKRAKKELAKIAPKNILKIQKAIDKLVLDPRPIASRKMVGSSGYRLRVNEYRVIYEINDLEIVIFIIKVGHRKDVYRK